MSSDKKPIIEINVTGFLPIPVHDAEILQYMTNIDVNLYKSLLGSKYKPDEYSPILLRIRDATNKVIEKNKVIQKAAASN